MTVLLCPLDVLADKLLLFYFGGIDKLVYKSSLNDEPRKNVKGKD